MDLSTLDTKTAGEKPALLTLQHPVKETPLVNDDDKTPWQLQLISADSDEYNAVRRNVLTQRIRQSAKTRKPTVTAEQVEADALDMLVACTKGWSGLRLQGKPLEYTPEAARMLYTEYAWIREQADAFINDRANFLGNE